MYHLKFKILFSRFAFWVKKKKKREKSGNWQANVQIGRWRDMITPCICTLINPAVLDNQNPLHMETLL